MNILPKKSGQKRRAEPSKHALKIVAGIGTLSLIALTATAMTGGNTGTSAPASAIAAANATVESNDNVSNDFAVDVGKTLAITTEADGSATAAGLYAATSVAGDGTDTVGVPMGPNRPVNLSSFAPLTTEGESIIYDINNSTPQVQQLVAGGGQFADELPVELEIVLTVDGEEVDPNTATDITGDVELSYNLKNNTAKEETITYTDVNGASQEITTTIAIPFAVHIDVTFGTGWANISAPFANAGFSAGVTLSGDTTMAPTAANPDPDGSMTMTARAEGAKLPAAVLRVTPQNTEGSISSAATPLAKTGASLTNTLEGKALPLLLKTQQGLGNAAIQVDNLLVEKVNPVLNLLSEIQLNPDNVNQLLEEAGTTVGDLGALLLGANSIAENGGVQLATLLADVVSPEAEAALIEVSEALEAVGTGLGEVIPIVEGAAAALEAAGPILTLTPDEILQIQTGDPNITLESAVRAAVNSLGLPIPTRTIMASLDQLFIDATGFALICGEATPCLGETSIGGILDAIALKKLSTTCETGFETTALWADPAYAAALDTGIAEPSTSPADKALLTRLKNLLNAQETALASENKAACVRAAEEIEKTLEDLFGELTTVGEGLADLVPLLTSLATGAENAGQGLAELAAQMPAIREALTRGCAATSPLEDLSDCGLIEALTITSAANAVGAAALQGGIADLILTIEPVVDDLFGIVNRLGDAAPQIEQTLALIPTLISQIAYGNVGAFVEGVTDLGTFGAKLTNGAEKEVAVNAAIDKYFDEGAGFPYGKATGNDVATSAVYTFELAAPAKATASTTARALFALLLLLVGAAGGTWAYRRRISA
ncbi:MAG: hypothetical protein K0U64_02870 [Actinomycetia bacterium]|nr:hypothetical protein [Actinomycetes bacterium]